MDSLFIVSYCCLPTQTVSEYEVIISDNSVIIKSFSMFFTDSCFAVTVHLILSKNIFVWRRTFSYITRLSHCLVLCRGFRIFVAQQPVRFLVLLDLRKTSHRRVKPVVCIIVIAHGDLADQQVSRARFHIKILILIWLQCNTFPGL